jgi:peptide/nickel transport system permease protein
MNIATSSCGALEMHPQLVRWLGSIAALLGQLAALLLVAMTLLFFLVRLTGDPAVVLSGDSADAAAIEALRVKYGLNEPLLTQYWTFLVNALQLDFGTSWVGGRSALEIAWERVPATLFLAASGMLVNLAISIPLGTYLGTNRNPPLRKSLDVLTFVMQGVPGYVVALFLIQAFVVEWRVFPSIGDVGLLSWVLPSFTIAAFLAPKLARVVAVNVSEAMQEDFVTMARAQGASYFEQVVRHALPNAMLGATALIGTQIAGLVNGIIITETIFGWPGIGRLLLDSVLLLDYPVVQAVVVITTCLVFIVNWLTDRLIEVIDPRLK